LPCTGRGVTDGGYDDVHGEVEQARLQLLYNDKLRHNNKPMFAVQAEVVLVEDHVDKGNTRSTTSGCCCCTTINKKAQAHKLVAVQAEELPVEEGMGDVHREVDQAQSTGWGRMVHANVEDNVRHDQNTGPA
jgi:hypothetical protein